MGVETIYDLGRTAVDCGGGQTAANCAACDHTAGVGNGDGNSGSGCTGQCSWDGSSVCSDESITASIFMQSCLIGTDLSHITILDNRIWHNADNLATTTPPSLPDSMFIVDKAAK